MIRVVRDAFGRVLPCCVCGADHQLVGTVERWLREVPELRDGILMARADARLRIDAPLWFCHECLTLTAPGVGAL